MDMRDPGAYFQSVHDHCKSKIRLIDLEIIKLREQKAVYEEIQWQLDTAIEKERAKAAGKIEY
jgi:hypothetical protein